MCRAPGNSAETPPAFPWLPMLAISVVLISHMFVQSSQFAYVGYMVQHLGVVGNKDEAGYYAGFLSSAFMVGRFASSYFWGMFADRCGRLPVLYVGLWSIAIFSIAFGVSTTFWWAFLCRFLLGALNGVSAICKTMVSEVCGKEHEMVGMGVTTTAWSIALVVGPGIGGILAEPAKNFPTVFSETGLFGRFPYLLPNLIGAGFALASLLMVLFFLEETSSSGYAPDELEDDRSDGDADAPGCGRRDEPTEQLFDKRMPVINGCESRKALLGDGCCRRSGCFVLPGSLLADPHVRAILFMNALYSFINIGFDEIFPLWALSTVGSGGLDWTTKDLGQVLSVVGIGILVFEMSIKPLFIKRLGVTRSQRWSSTLSVALYLSVPFLSRLHDTGLPLDVACTTVLFMAHACANAMYINIALATNNAVERSRRGEFNGLAMTACSMAKATAPFACAVVFAWSIGHHHSFPLNHDLIYILLGLGMLGVVVMGWNTITTTTVDRDFQHPLLVLHRSREVLTQVKKTSINSSNSSIADVGSKQESSSHRQRGDAVGQVEGRGANERQALLPVDARVLMTYTT